jgi:hypothetical protein
MDMDLNRGMDIDTEKDSLNGPNTRKSSDESIHCYSGKVILKS